MRRVLADIRRHDIEAAIRVAAAVGLPLLGVVELIPDAQVLKAQARSLRRVIAAFFALVFLYAGGMLVLSYQTGLFSLGGR